MTETTAYYQGRQYPTVAAALAAREARVPRDTTIRCAGCGASRIAPTHWRYDTATGETVHVDLRTEIGRVYKTAKGAQHVADTFDLPYHETSVEPVPGGYQAMLLDRSYWGMA